MRTKKDARDQYMNRISQIEDSVLIKIKESLAGDELTGMHIQDYEAKILQFLMALGGVKDVLEIGTLYGYSTYALAKALPFDGSLVTIDSKQEHTARAQELIRGSEVFDRIEFMTGDAPKVLQSIEDSFDMVFIDANKGGYPDYLKWAKDHIRKGGLIIGDNSFLFGHVFGEPFSNESESDSRIKKMQAFNQALLEDSNFSSCIIPTGEGLTVGVRL